MGFARELGDVFPQSQFHERGTLDRIEDVAKDAAGQEFTVLIVVGESSKMPSTIVFIVLPTGPTFYFKVSSVVLKSKITNHGKSSDYNPEIILNNFSTRLGLLVGQLFMGLFPQVEFQGRQVVTFHNQRDFIFFRRHRYIFDSDEARGVRIQELGPQFTMKLTRVTECIYKPLGDDCVFDHSMVKVEKRSKSRETDCSTNNKIFAL